MTIKMRSLIALLVATRRMEASVDGFIMPLHNPKQPYKSTTLTKKPLTNTCNNSSKDVGDNGGGGNTLWDKFKGTFLKQREGDFVPLMSSDMEKFVPGLTRPSVILYNTPPGITLEEFQDMISDGAPKAAQKGVVLYHIYSYSYSNEQDQSILQLPMEEALQGIESGKWITSETVIFNGGATVDPSTSVVLLFSAFDNDEMLATYKIMAQEIYDETGGQISPACAKAVPKAMKKPLGQVLEEIGGDHQEALRMMQERKQDNDEKS